MSGGTQDERRDGPTNPTRLAVAFYAAYKRSRFRSYEELADEIGSTRSTVSAYLNGMRGGGRRDTGTTIRLLAAALGMDPDEAVELSGVRVHTDVVEVERAIRSLNWPRDAQDELIAVLREMDQLRRRR